MVELQMEPELEEKVRSVAFEEKISESFLIHEIVAQWLEDREDYNRGIQVLAKTKYTISQEEMDRRAELAD